jgi:hypothetical protein
MLRKIGLLSVVALGVCFGGANIAQADHFYHYSGYRPPVVYYNSYNNGWNAPMYRPYVGQPIPSTFSHGYTSYYGGNYGTGVSVSVGGYGVAGFPRPVVAPVVAPIVRPVVAPVVGSVVRPVVGSVVRPVVGSVVRPVVGAVVRPAVRAVVPPLRPGVVVRIR